MRWTAVLAALNAIGFALIERRLIAVALLALVPLGIHSVLSDPATTRRNPDLAGAKLREGLLAWALVGAAGLVATLLVGNLGTWWDSEPGRFLSFFIFSVPLVAFGQVAAARHRDFGAALLVAYVPCGVILLACACLWTLGPVLMVGGPRLPRWVDVGLACSVAVPPFLGLAWAAVELERRLRDGPEED